MSISLSHTHSHGHPSHPKGELKWFDTVPSGTINLTSAVIIPLDSIAEGTGQSQRIGVQIQPHSSYTNIINRINPETSVDCMSRALLFTWKSIDVPIPAQILTDPSNIQSPLNIDYSKSFWVHWDKKFPIGLGQSVITEFQEYQALHKRTTYAADNTNQTTMNGTYMLLMSDQTSSASEPILTLYHRLRYQDC